MSNDLVTNDGNKAIATPDYLASIFGNKEANINVAEQVDTLKIGGKVWTVVTNGDEKPLMEKNADGEKSPMPIVKVVILNHIATRSRAYFKDAYVEGSDQSPVCYSILGQFPEKDCPEPQAKSCESCPQSVKGSKINEQGEPTVACPMSRRLAVVPETHVAKFPPLLLKLPVTSLWEGKGKGPQEANGWYAYDNYLKMLKSNGILFTAAVVTWMKFDADVKYPKVLFKYAGILDEERMTAAAARMDSDEVKHVLGLDRAVTEAVENVSHETSETSKKAEENFTTDTKEAVKETKASKKTKEPEVEENAFGGEEPAKSKKETKASKAADNVKAAVADNEDELKSLLDDWS